MGLDLGDVQHGQEEGTYQGNQVRRRDSFRGVHDGPDVLLLRLQIGLQEHLHPHPLQLPIGIANVIFALGMFLSSTSGIISL